MEVSQRRYDTPGDGAYPCFGFRYVSGCASGEILHMQIPVMFDDVVSEIIDDVRGRERREDADFVLQRMQLGWETSGEVDGFNGEDTAVGF